MPIGTSTSVLCTHIYVRIYIMEEFSVYYQVQRGSAFSQTMIT